MWSCTALLDVKLFDSVIYCTFPLSIACNPAQLTNAKIHNDEISCGASFSALQIENGFVCYSRMNVGSSAVYFCLDCNYNYVKHVTGPLLRTCGKNGHWNGTIPKCECSKLNNLN